MDYKNAGVDIEAGYKSVELMKEHVKKTMRPEVLGGLGGFSGAFSLAKIKEMEEPVLLSGTDGCGTKVKLAMILDKHDTIGIDAVAMCVNDIACAGGEPLFFLDYIACGKNYPEKIASIVKGVAEGCLQSEAALVGGEAAGHPGLMPEEDYDLAGFAVGVAEKSQIMKKIVFLATHIGLINRGAETFVIEIVKKLSKDYKVVVYSKGISEEKKDYIENSEILINSIKVFGALAVLDKINKHKKYVLTECTKIYSHCANIKMCLFHCTSSFLLLFKFII